MHIPLSRDERRFRQVGFSGRACYKNVPTLALIINNPHVIIPEHVHIKLRRAGRAYNLRRSRRAMFYALHYGNNNITSAPVMKLQRAKMLWPSPPPPLCSFVASAEGE